MWRPSVRAYAFASVVVALAVVIGALVTAVYSNTTTTSSVSNSSTSSAITVNTSSTVSASQSIAGDCLIPVQPIVNITLNTSAYTPGTLVSYSRDQQVFYPENMCPQPVSNKTYEFGANFPNAVTWVPTSNYQLALAAVSNPKFISLENGSEYLYSQPESSSLSSSDDNSLVMGPTNGSYGYTFSLVFYRYSDTVNNCFGRESFNATAGIEVDFFAPTFQLVNGSRPMGSWILNDPSIYALSPGKIMAEEDLCSLP
ncbi:MAG: hypothetical protein OK441_05100 [Thaumarchaeota archaeon]|nr:hypothetical protein [Nitrososphaerota archaeon]